MDKDGYILPFVRELKRRKITYWLDKAEINWGERISASINEGLQQSHFVVVFLSKSFVGRDWTETELSAALNRENSEGRTVVLQMVN